MPEAAEYQILAAMKTRLEGITTANGYETDVKRVSLFEESWEQYGDFPMIVLLQTQALNDDAKFGGSNLTEVTTTYALALQLDGIDSTHSRVGKFVADVKRRLLSDQPLYLGGATRRLWIGKVEGIHGTPEDPRSGALVEVFALFRHPTSDPYTLVP